MPTVVPMTVMMKTTVSAIISEMREPWMARDSTSRPNLSVPRKCTGWPSVEPKKCRFAGIRPKSL